MCDRHQAEMFIDQLVRVLFGQGCAKNEFVITSCLATVQKELTELLKVCCNTDETGAGELALHFFERLQSVYDLLLEDAVFLEASDPAANSVDEVILTYPGFYAIAVHRFSHELYKLEGSLSSQAYVGICPQQNCNRHSPGSYHWQSLCH